MTHLPASGGDQEDNNGYEYIKINRNGRKDRRDFPGDYLHGFILISLFLLYPALCIMRGGLKFTG